MSVSFIFEHQELRLTILETYIVLSDDIPGDIDMQDVPITNESDSASEVEVDTPKPRKAFEWSEDEAKDSQWSESEGIAGSGEFITPKALKKRAQPLAAGMLNGRDGYRNEIESDRSDNKGESHC